MSGSGRAEPPTTASTGPSATAQRLVALLLPHTPFAEAIVKRQAERAQLSLATLDESHVPTLAPLLFAASSVFIDPAAREALKKALKLR